MAEGMTWEQKLYALKALAEVTLNMRKPGDWYACMHAELKGDGVLTSSAGDGASPAQAVEDLWEQYAEADVVVVLNAMDAQARREVRWNGFMWEDAHAG